MSLYLLYIEIHLHDQLNNGESNVDQTVYHSIKMQQITIIYEISLPIDHRCFSLNFL